MSVLKTLILVFVGSKKESYLTLAKKMSDGELVDKINASKDSQLFGILYDRYGNKVYNKCFSFAKNDSDAKDLTQEIFLKVFLKLQLFNSDKASFSTWLYVMVYNFCINYVNRDKKKENRSEPLDAHEYHLSEENVEIDEINTLNAEKLTKALELLAPEEKSLLLLKYQDDVSIKELQASFDVGESAIKMRLNRAKAKVVKIYDTL
ncbi:RNA polymerase sigma factor [Maribacter sp. ACAM166]|uniref:RNA polymerase sigma factor n=1 Tax=Maribacter sp. ACAM166 TaxID=2508996 RepID=UPI0010FE09FC|nr:RNA polymerase sigma factor [Maribacter sp. ACAM166]TLP80129.1 RNA polymerase sigma factor [Maribacter sp. ACAM166]